ncbi:hypothetical protein NicSoilC12_05950 [Arthrobacter sp. NicSoilC12]|nr:hypothetical protein NicSoilC12_05950 [Arthrobacter sp. NicSoilC12]
MLKLAAKSMVVLRAHSGPEVEVDYSAAASLAAMAEHEDSADAGSAVPAPETPADAAPETPADPAPAPEATATGASKGSAKASGSKKAAADKPKSPKGRAK